MSSVVRKRKYVMGSEQHLARCGGHVGETPSVSAGPDLFTKALLVLALTASAIGFSFVKDGAPPTAITVVR